MRAISTSLIAFYVVLAQPLPGFAEPGEKPVIAVGTSKTKWSTSGACRGYASTYADTLMDSLRSRISQSGAARIVSRAQMAKLLKEHEMGMVGLTDPNRSKQLGKLLQADYLAAIDFICQPDALEINLNFWDTETGESVFTTVKQLSKLRKYRRALKDITKEIKDFIKSGKKPKAPDEGCGFLIVDSRAFHDASEYIVAQIRSTIPKATGTIEEINTYDESIKVNISHSGYTPWAGLKLKVSRAGEEELGWVYLTKKGHGKIVAGTNDDMSRFEEGDKISSEEFEPKVAIGYIEDVDEDMTCMADKFRERMYTIMQQSDGIEPANDSEIDKIIQRMGPKRSKKDLAKLHKAGVDLLIIGRFLGENGSRRLDFEVISTYDGKRVIDIKRDRIGL